MSLGRSRWSLLSTLFPTVHRPQLPRSNAPFNDRPIMCSNHSGTCTCHTCYPKRDRFTSFMKSALWRQLCLVLRQEITCSFPVGRWKGSFWLRWGCLFSHHLFIVVLIMLFGGCGIIGLIIISSSLCEGISFFLFCNVRVSIGEWRCSLHIMLPMKVHSGFGLEYWEIARQKEHL